jgi:hypothetical protein
LSAGHFKGDPFGSFEHLNLGATSLASLVTAGLDLQLPDSHSFSPVEYKAPQKPRSLKPDAVYLQRHEGTPLPVAVGEHKKANEFSGTGASRRLLKAQEQALL